MNVGLRIKRQFQNGKALYMPKVSSTDPDAFVPDDHWQAWPAETLANRLKHDFVAWEPVPEAGTVVTEEPVISELDKDGLVLYAEQRFGVTLDKRTSEATMRQQIGAMQERASLLATQDARGKAIQAARRGDGAATVGAKSPVSPPKAPKAAAAAPQAPAAEPPTPPAGDQGTGGTPGTDTGNDSPPAP